MICYSCKDGLKEVCERFIYDLNMRNRHCEEFNNYGLYHWVYYLDFEKKKYINYRKNDEKLFKHILNNNLLSGEDTICYYNLATKLVKYNFYFKPHECNSLLYEALMSYLYWAYGSPNDENNILNKELEKMRELRIQKEVEYEKQQELIKNALKEKLKQRRHEIEVKYKKNMVNVRTGQSKYREDLKSIYRKCQICGIENNDLLVASHIKPYSISKLDEAIDFDNGFLLCRMHDGLFDSGLISFNDDGTIIISNKLSVSDRKKIKELEQSKIKVDEAQKKYLKYHRKHIFK
ncbi:MAG: HNH endonuclease [Clostridium butyricum]|nr:MAG TPA: HNH endonuclease [Caudoviricetes sp.]